jgi:hypothetical protein
MKDTQSCRRGHICYPLFTLGHIRSGAEADLVNVQVQT